MTELGGSRAGFRIILFVGELKLESVVKSYVYSGRSIFFLCAAYCKLDLILPFYLVDGNFQLCKR